MDTRTNDQVLEFIDIIVDINMESRIKLVKEYKSNYNLTHDQAQMLGASVLQGEKT